MQIRVAVYVAIIAFLIGLLVGLELAPWAAVSASS